MNQPTVSKNPTALASPNGLKQPSPQQNYSNPPHTSLTWRVLKWGTLATLGSTVLTTVGAVWTAVRVRQDAKARRLASDVYQQPATAQPYYGRIERVGEQLSFITASSTYALADPLALIDDMAKDQGVALSNSSGVFCLETGILANLSPKGHYGYLGHLSQQLTIVAALDDKNGANIETNDTTHHHNSSEPIADNHTQLAI